jgi:type II secretion system protein C
MWLLALVVMAVPPPDLTAVGVVLSPRPEASVALLRSAGRSRVARVGEAAFGGRVVAVEVNRIVLDFDGRRVDLALPGALPDVAPAQRATVAVEAAAAPPLERTLPRFDVEKRLAAELPRILAETALSPVSEGGRVVGLRLVRLAEGTLLSEVGLRPGDVLIQINDTATDSLAALMALWPRLQGATELRASVLRDGQSVSLSLGLR